MSTLITPPGTFALGWLNKPRLAKGRPPTEEPSYFCRVLYTDGALASSAWKSLEAALDDAGYNHFGKDYERLKKQVPQGFRLPIRRDVEAKGYSSEYVAFLNQRE